MRRIALALVSLFLSASASAEILTFEYTGVINTLRETFDNGGSHALVSTSKIPGGVRVGDDFHGIFSIDTHSEVLGMSATYAFYYDSERAAASTSITFDKSGATSAKPYAVRSVSVSRNSDYSSVFIDAPRATAFSDPSNYQALSFRFSSFHENTLANVAIPTNFNVADWYSASAELYWLTDNGGISMSGMLTSVNRVSAVPEPESYAMLLAGLGLVAGVAARRKQQRG